MEGTRDEVHGSTLMMLFTADCSVETISDITAVHGLGEQYVVYWCGFQQCLMGKLSFSASVNEL